MTKKQNVSWEEWIQELKIINKLTGENLGKVDEIENLDYQSFYNDNFTPAQCAFECLTSN